MKKIEWLLIVVFVFFATACEKDNSVVPIDPEPDPDPVIERAEIHITFGDFPEGMIGFHPIGFGLLDIEGNSLSSNLADIVKYPEFKYKVSQEITEDYFQKDVIVYLSVCREFAPNRCWGMEERIQITLREEVHLEIEIPPK